MGVVAGRYLLRFALVRSYFTKMESETVHEKKNNLSEAGDGTLIATYGTDMNYKHKYLWAYVILLSALHIGWLIGFYTLFFHTKYLTMIWAIFIGLLAAQGTNLGAHRGYTHRSFKPSKPLKVALFFCQTMAGQNSMFTWARDHRIHHKYSDTDADPHNSNRGLFFAHMGWLMMRKHPLVLKKQREMDFSDFLEDKLLMFQYKYFLYFYFPLGLIMPVSVPVYFWNESLWSSFFVVYCLQYVTNLHSTWSINSFAHHVGTKPYDTRIGPVESWITSFLTLGEGWHNFHHSFPWDYRLGEKYSLSTNVLYLLSRLGLAYDLKIASRNVIEGHQKRYGDGADKKMLVEEVIEFKRQGKDESEPVRGEKPKVA